MFKSHIGTPWFERVKEESKKGKGHIYSFGLKHIKDIYKSFIEQGYDKIPPYHQSYTPNPFVYQYDFCVYLWLNYKLVLDREISYLRAQKLDDLADELLQSQTIYGVSRADLIFAAGDLRWPTTILPDGGHHGSFIRDPWSDIRLKAISDYDIKNVISFGGGGQGKTHISIGFALMMFDNFIHTERGARCMISTVNEDKLNAVAWSYLCRLNSSTNQDISLYAGRGKISGDHTISRPGIKDKGGVFKGILIGNQMNTQTIIDKLTGSHGHPFLCYILDEMQSTPSVPIDASNNFTMHAGDYRILGAGNYGENHDTLALNVEPDTGWDTVDENTGQWISTMQNGAKAICLHFNNNNSPGMTDDGNKIYPHLPNKKILNNKYPPDKRNTDNLSYRRFWIGWRTNSVSSNIVLTDTMVKESNADLPFNVTQVTHNFGAFDSAQAELDRNFFLACIEGLDKETKARVFGPRKAYQLEKTTESDTYFKKSSNEILTICRRENIQSGGVVVDWTGRPAHSEILAREGFLVRKLVYNMAVPDGKRVSPITGRKEKAIKLNINVDEKNSIPAEHICAHHVCSNMISLGAWALREYIKAGRVRGLSPNLFNGIQSQSVDRELYSRTFYKKASAAYGELFTLTSKDEFKKAYGFSPDILDCLCQMAWYALIVRGIPLTHISLDAKLPSMEDIKDQEEMENKLWEMDELYEL
jgi:hypothetical protein